MNTATYRREAAMCSLVGRRHANEHDDVRSRCALAGPGPGPSGHGGRRRAAQPGDGQDRRLPPRLVRRARRAHRAGRRQGRPTGAGRAVGRGGGGRCWRGRGRRRGGRTGPQLLAAARRRDRRRPRAPPPAHRVGALRRGGGSAGRRCAADARAPGAARVRARRRRRQRRADRRRRRHDRRPGRRHDVREQGRRRHRRVPRHGGRQDRRSAVVRLRHRRRADGRAHPSRGSPPKLRLPPGCRLPGGRRHPRQLRRSRADRQAPRQRPHHPQEVASGGARPGDRWLGGGRAAGAAAERPAGRGRGGPGHRAGRGLRRPGRHRGARPRAPRVRLRGARRRRARADRVRRAGRPGPLRRGTGVLVALDFVAGTETATTTRAAEALARARDHLLALQSPEGWWKGELETNVTMDAEDLLLRHVLGLLDPPTAEAAARWIRSQQRDDGTWATFHGAPGDLSTTVEAYVALRLAGDAPDAPHLRQARDFVLEQGGIIATRVFTRIWLALVAQWSWDDLPALPPEVILLPPRVPLNVYDFACWARQTIVPLTVVAAHRLVRPLPFTLDELAVDRGAMTPLTTASSGGSGSGGAGRRERWFARLDRVLTSYERLPRWAPPKVLLRRPALRLAEQWILRRQEADGSWGGIQPPWVYSLLALHVLGYPLDHPAMASRAS